MRFTSRATGGDYFSASRGGEAITRVKEVLTAEFGRLDLDRRVLAERHTQPDLPADALATRLGSSRPAAATLATSPARASVDPATRAQPPRRRIGPP